jgi:hypothetical protein
VPRHFFVAIPTNIESPLHSGGFRLCGLTLGSDPKTLCGSARAHSAERHSCCDGGIYSTSSFQIVEAFLGLSII